jgi:hypothetical protein
MEISLPTALTRILGTKWSKINDFHAYFVFPTGTLLKAMGDDAMINFALKSLTLPAKTQQSIEVYTGGQWLVANGRPDVAKVECTFRDFNDFKLYRGFSELFEKTLGNYNDETYTTLKVATGDTSAGASAYSKESIIAIFEELIIENVSQISFDNTTEDQIAEFSVTFRGKRAKTPGGVYYEPGTTGDIRTQFKKE